MKFSKQGFSLIELLIVIAIIAILASFVFFNTRDMREAARISVAAQFQESTHRALGANTVSWWLLDGNLEDNWSHSHGIDHGGSFQEGVPVMGGRQAWEGTNSSITLTGVPLNILTISFWIKVESGINNQSILNNVFPNHVRMENGRLRVSGVEMNQGINDGVWHHVTVTKFNNDIYFHLDGKRAEKSGSYSSAPGAGGLTVGPFTGLLADIRTYSVPLEQ